MSNGYGSVDHDVDGRAAKCVNIEYNCRLSFNKCTWISVLCAGESVDL